jgi:hypothetical protein
LSEDDFDEILSSVTQDITRRNEVINRELASEYTMREFISPILVGALRLVLKFLRKSGNCGKLSLVCEKIIVGLHAHGPVDYVLTFDYLDIVITEAKTSEISQGVVQNLLQQRASQEFLTNVLLDFYEVGESRKRRFKEAFDDIASISCGSTTTGSDWIFTKICYDSISKKSVIMISEKFRVDLGGTQEVLREAIKPILSILVRMTTDQIDAVANNPNLAAHRQRIWNAGAVFNLQAKEGNAVEDEINSIQVTEEEEEEEEEDM